MIGYWQTSCTHWPTTVTSLSHILNRNPKSTVRLELIVNFPHFLPPSNPDPTHPYQPNIPPPKKNLVMPSTKPDLVLYFYCEYRIFLPVIVAAVPMNHRCDKCSRLEVLHWITIGCAPTWLLDLILSIVSKDEWPWPTSRLPLQWSAVTVTPSGIGKSITVTNCHSNSSFLRALKWPIFEQNPLTFDWYMTQNAKSSFSLVLLECGCSN